jgi:hypothetical protein
VGSNPTPAAVAFTTVCARWRMPGRGHLGGNARARRDRLIDEGVVTREEVVARQEQALKNAERLRQLAEKAQADLDRHKQQSA